ncbi:MAG: HEAT repeat domain-containing protein [Elusimicrobiota bacterium]
MEVKIFPAGKKSQQLSEKYSEIKTVENIETADCVLITATFIGELKDNIEKFPDKDLVVWWQAKKLPEKKILDSLTDIFFCKTDAQLLYKLKSTVPKISNDADRKPLTGLPGNRSIKKRLEKISNDSDKVAVYLDLTDFKPYNEVYGFSAGDSVIVGFSELLKGICDEIGGDETFLGHIGGDDFIAIIKKEYLEKFFERVDTGFLNIRNSFYEEGDIARGSIIGWDRNGQKRNFKLMGICGVGFSPRDRNLDSARKISEFATYLKDSAKSLRDRDNIFITPSDIKIIKKSPQKFLTDKNIPLYHRRTFVEAMGESGFSHYGNILTDLLEENIEGFLKKSVIFALGRLRYTPSEEVILKYAGDGNPHLRMRAVEALGNFGKAEYIDFIGEKLRDNNNYVAVAAAKSLAAIGHPDALKFLKDASPKASGWLKIEFVIARTRLGDRSVSKKIADLLNDPDPVFRKKAGRSLENIPHVDNFLLLYKRLNRENDRYVRNSLIISASRIISKIPGSKIKKIRKKIWKLYKKTPGNLKSYILPGLGRVKSGKARKALKNNLKSKKSWVRQASVKGLGELKEEDSYKLVRKKLTDYSARVRESAARAMGKLEDVNGLEYLRKSLKDKDKMVRKAASGSVIKIIRRSYGKPRR